MSKKQRKKNNEEKSPLPRKGLQKAVYVEAKERIPRKLNRIGSELDANLKPFDFEWVATNELDQLSDQLIKPLLPKWMSQCHKPKRAVHFGHPERQLNHRGKKVDPLVVLGRDDRRTYSDTSYPWGCVCKVITSAGSGSGIIVGPRHVLTASHVINWAASGGVNGTVEVHRAGPTVSAISRITRVHAFTRVTGSVGWSELDEDYAVLITADRIGDRFGWVGTRTYNSSWDDEPFWTNIGYPGDVAGAMFPIFQRGKELDEHAWDFGSGRAMDTNADINPGQSGGPMFAFWSDGPYVVAVVSAHDIEDRDNYCSGGSDLTRLVRFALNANP